MRWEAIPDINPFSFEELRHWFSVLKKKDPEWHDLILFWSRTGIRPGELAALRWEHVDYFNRKILIRQNLQYNGEIGPTKTVNSSRDVDLRPAVIDAIRRQETRTGLMRKWLWVQPGGKRLHHSFIQEKFKHLCRLAGLTYRPPKQMRHTFATLHIAAGESATWVSKMLGHSSLEITLSKYNRFVPNLTRDDGSAFENIMDGPDNPKEKKHG